MTQSYKTYLFKDKDPIIDILLRTLIKDEGVTFMEIAEISGVTSGTLSKWFYGETKRPQFATANAVARALGYELVPVSLQARAKPAPSAPIYYPRFKRKVSK